MGLAPAEPPTACPIPGPLRWEPRGSSFSGAHPVGAQEQRGVAMVLCPGGGRGDLPRDLAPQGDFSLNSFLPSGPLWLGKKKKKYKIIKRYETLLKTMKGEPSRDPQALFCLLFTSSSLYNKGTCAPATQARTGSLGFPHSQCAKNSLPRWSQSSYPGVTLVAASRTSKVWGQRAQPDPGICSRVAPLSARPAPPRISQAPTWGAGPGGG